VHEGSGSLLRTGSDFGDVGEWEDHHPVGHDRDLVEVDHAPGSEVVMVHKGGGHLAPLLTRVR